MANSVRTMKSKLLDSLVFAMLISTCRKQGRFWVRPWWKSLEQRFLKRNSAVRCNIHGRTALVAFGNPYPINARLYPGLNGPLLELVSETFKIKQHPLRIVDIGAALGDTVLLLNANCKEMISEYVCVDGDAEFFGFLRANLSFLSNVQFALVQLSRSEGFSPSLVRTHAGTASAQGQTNCKTASFDGTSDSMGLGPIDVLKIDVDGFDGAVLAGAQNTLKRDRPHVVFEWHPILCMQTGNSWFEAFETLGQCGYKCFLWFDKFGNFSHFMPRYDATAVDMMAAYCLADVPTDWHFDVIAVHESSQIDVQQLAQLRFSRNRLSPY
jgi:FkbM family methyltransferase